MFISVNGKYFSARMHRAYAQESREKPFSVGDKCQVKVFLKLSEP